jgi:hypothetical protein
MSHLIRPGTYQLQLKVAAANCAVVTKTIEITITGSWHIAEGRGGWDKVAMTTTFSD